MRVSIRPRRTIAKAASWPFISGSAVGNKSSCFNESVAFRQRGILICLTILIILTFVSFFEYSCRRIINSDGRRNLICSGNVDVVNLSGSVQFSGPVYQCLHLLSVENKIRGRLVHGLFASGQHLPLVSWGRTLVPLAFERLWLFQKDQSGSESEVPSWRPTYIAKGRLNDHHFVDFESAHSHFDNFNIGTVDCNQSTTWRCLILVKWLCSNRKMARL